MATKRTHQHRRHCIALAAVAVLDAPLLALALPQGGQVVEGQVTIGAPAAGQLGITQGSARAVVDWRSFGIGANERVSLAQPTGGAALFRVTGSDPSQIFGSLSATGALFLSNPNGVLFGAGARVDVGSLAATTLGMTNADFMAGRLRLAGASRASVVNEGRIEAAPGGSVVLLGASVSNSGTISAPQGSVALGAGSAATLDVYGNGLLKLTLTDGADGASVTHSGTVQADGGVVNVATLGRSGGAPAAINMAGLVRAQSLTARDGAIYLSGGAGSQLSVGGTLDVSSADAGAQAGRIDVTGERITLDATARLQADAKSSGDGGTVNAIATDAMAFAATISARGGATSGNGGNAEVSGYGTVAVSGSADLTAAKGKLGSLLIDPLSITVVRDDAVVFQPGLVSDAWVNQQLGLSSLALVTNVPPLPFVPDDPLQWLTVAPDVRIEWAAASTLALGGHGRVVIGERATIRNTSASTGFDAISLSNLQFFVPILPPIRINVDGILLQPGARLETTGGNIRLDGIGGEFGDRNVGIRLNGATIATVNGQIALSGQGGGGTTGNAGVHLDGISTIRATGTGSINIFGAGGAGTSATGVAAAQGSFASIETASGRLEVTAIAGSPTDTALAVDAPVFRLRSDSGDVGIKANTVQLQPTNNISTSGTIAFTPFQPLRPILVGGADSPTTLGLNANDLFGVRAGRLEIGDTLSGKVTVSSPFTLIGTVGTLALTSFERVQVDAALNALNARVVLSGTQGVQLGAPVTSVASDAGATRAITVRSSIGDFVNTAGNMALSTPFGSWTVSLSDPVGSNFGGLQSGNAAVWSNPVSGIVAPAGNRYSFAVAPTIYIVPEDATKVYGDIAPSTVTLRGASVNAVTNNFGGAFTDYNSGTVSGSYTTTSPGDAATANVGTYARQVASLAGLTTDKAGYRFAAGGNGGLTVTPRPIFVAAAPVSRLYGNANPVSGAATVTLGSLANADAIGSVSLASPAAAGANVGSYALDASAAVFSTGLASNYTIGYETNANGLRITPRPLTLTPDAAGRVYGDTNPTRGSATVTVGSLVNGDRIADVGLSSPAVAGSFVGSYALTANAAAFAAGGPGNYDITYVVRANGLTVTQRPVTLTLGGNVSRPYGGGANTLAITNPTATAGSLVAGDFVSSYAFNFGGPAPTAPVGTYATPFISVSLFNGANQNVTANYAITRVDAPFFVTPRPLTLTPVALSRIYGDANPSVAAVTGNAGFGVGLVNGDTVSQVALTSPALPTSNVGLYATTGSNAVFATGAASNYAITYASNANGLSVTPRLLTLKPGVVSRAYGDANPSTGTTTGNVGGLVNGDTVASVTLASSATSASNVGSYGTSASNAVFGSGLATNYTISYAPNPAGLVVTPRAVTLTPDVVSRIYGDANPVSGTATGNAGGLVNGDAVASVTLASSATTASNVGSYDTSASNAIFGSGLATNYTVTYSPNAAGLVVTPRSLTLTPDAVSRIYGDANPVSGTATGNAGGLVNGDTLASVVLASSATSASNVGSYDTTPTIAVFGTGLSTNYAIAYAPNPVGLVVTPRVLVVTPDAASRIYGDANPVGGSASGNNLVNGDTLASVSITSPATPTSNVGLYPTDASAALFSNGLAGNYTISYARNPAGLDITPRPLTLTPNPTTRPYGDANPVSFTAFGNAGGLVNGDSVASVTLATSATPASNVGSYDTTGSNALFASGQTGNYTISYATNPAGLDVTPRALTLTPVATSRLYGDVNPLLGSAAANAGGLVNGDSVASVSLATPAAATSNVGTYSTSADSALFATGLASNYTIAYTANPLGLAVTARPLTVTPDAVSRLYGESNPTTATARGNNLVNGDALASVSIASAADAASNVGAYSSSADSALFSSGLATNYAITYADNAAGLAVAPRPLTLTPDALSRTYGDANPTRGAASGSAGGLVNGDTVASVALASPAVVNSGIGRYDLAASDALFGAGNASNYLLSYAALPSGLLITPRSVDVAALPGQAKVAGRPDPVLAYGIASGSLVSGDAFTGSLTRAAGEAIGSYPILQGTLSLGPNYTLGYTGAPFTVASTGALAVVDRSPAVGAPAQAAGDLLTALPPTAAGPATDALATECVRDASLGSGTAGARLVNRGMRLPAGVVDACRPTAASGS